MNSKCCENPISALVPVVAYFNVCSGLLVLKVHIVLRDFLGLYSDFLEMKCV